MTMKIRVGQGFDVHAFAVNRKLFLGGVEIPHSHGLEGHSDADVLLHAICDALLGAAGLSDIGHFFPNTEARWKDVSSLELLRQVHAEIKSRAWALINADVTLLAQAPRIASYIPLMKQNISKVLECSCDQISIKATTTEKLGFVGRQEGMTASAVVLLQGV